jgi:hypothetical protein
MSALTYYDGNSQFLEIGGLKDQSTTPATYMNNATLTATMYDALNVIVPGADAMSGVYQTSSNGVYRFLVDPTVFNPNPGTYTVKINGTMSGGAKYKVDLKVKVKDRTTGLET